MDIWLKWSQIYYEQGDFEKAIEIILKGIDELPETSELYYRATAYLIAAGKYKQAFNYLENALILNFENHTVLLEFFPKLQTQKALFKIIDQYRKENF
jgi:tetratricopeptide (TPR) repeat protein